jgi:YidC/Oxa1 family membrane protein insertase
VLDPIYYAVSAVLWFWHEALGLGLDPASGTTWALSVVLLVLTLRALLVRPFLAQVRSARAARSIAPQLAELRKRHADDPARLVRESRALQKENGVSAAGTLMPLLLQIPVFIGLFHVLQYPGYVFGPDEVRAFLDARLFGAPLSAYLSMPQAMLDAFGVARWDVALVAVPLMLLAAVATHLTARHSLQHQPVEGPTAAIMRWTPWVFPLGAIVGGALFPLPIAILVYWLANNLWTLGQQHLVFRTPGP